MGHEGVQGSEATGCDIVRVTPCRDRCVQSHGRCSTESDPTGTQRSLVNNNVSHQSRVLTVRETMER